MGDRRWSRKPEGTREAWGNDRWQSSVLLYNLRLGNQLFQPHL